MLGAIYVKNSKNRKISGENGKIDATYTSISKTCSPECKLGNDGSCYAKQSYVGIVNSRLTKEAKKLNALQVARSEAMAIDQSYKGGDVPDGRILRLHVSGDSRTVKGSKLINSAVGRWKKRGKNLTAYSYTHSWKNVPAKIWTHVSMLASVDDIKDAKLAQEMGYPPALVVGEHISDKTYILDGSDVKWIPCPSQTRDVACVDCGLCMKASYLHQSNHGIAFAAHGSGTNKIKRRLNVIK